MAAWRRVCFLMPWRASMSMMRDVGVQRRRRPLLRVVLLVAGAVDDDEAAMRGVEVAPGDVDGDALLALGDEAVHEQAEIRIAAVDALAALDGGALIIEEISRIPQQAADQRGFAVIHRAAGQDAQHARELGRDGVDRPRCPAAGASFDARPSALLLISDADLVSAFSAFKGITGRRPSGPRARCALIRSTLPASFPWRRLRS